MDGMGTISQDSDGVPMPTMPDDSSSHEASRIVQDFIRIPSIQTPSRSSTTQTVTDLSDSVQRGPTTLGPQVATTPGPQVPTTQLLQVPTTQDLQAATNSSSANQAQSSDSRPAPDTKDSAAGPSSPIDLDDRQDADVQTGPDGVPQDAGSQTWLKSGHMQFSKARDSASPKPPRTTRGRTGRQRKRRDAGARDLR